MGLIASWIYKLIKFCLNGRKYDFLVDEDYLERWHLIARNKWPINIYFHHFIGSDAPVPHDHPWWSVSFVLKGSYIEHTPEGDFIRKAGSVTFRKAEGLHWVEVDKPVWTLFITGPRKREWGFKCGMEWIHHRKYIEMRGSDRLANGCGES